MRQRLLAACLFLACGCSPLKVHHAEGNLNFTQFGAIDVVLSNEAYLASIQGLPQQQALAELSRSAAEQVQRRLELYLKQRPGPLGQRQGRLSMVQLPVKKGFNPQWMEGPADMGLAKERLADEDELAYEIMFSEGHGSPAIFSVRVPAKTGGSVEERAEAVDRAFQAIAGFIKAPQSPFRLAEPALSPP